VRSIMRVRILTGCCILMAAAEAAAQGTRPVVRFQPDRRLFSRLFPADLRGPLRIRPEVRTVERERPANRECEGCEERPGTAHLVMDSPRLTNTWLSRHTYQANGGSFGDNVAIADFWYDAVHRRIFSRSLVLHEVDDPADLRLGRAAGTYPNDIDLRGTLGAGTTVGHVGFVPWTQNGFGSYFAALQGATRDTHTGYLDLSTVTGEIGTTRTGSRYNGEDLIKHVRLHPSGQLEVGFETNPDARPDASLLVRGNTRLEGALSVEGEAHVGALTTERLTTSALTIASGGNVPHACTLRSATSRSRDAAAACDSGQLAISGGGTCASGELRSSRPTQTGDTPDGWALTCSRNGVHTAFVICCAR
jgi:hypothetical protein